MKTLYVIFAIVGLLVICLGFQQMLGHSAGFSDGPGPLFGIKGERGRLIASFLMTGGALMLVGSARELGFDINEE